MLKGVHFIDTSIFLSIIFHDDNEREARKYLARIHGGIYEAYISHLVIGEIAVAIRDKISLDEFGTFYDAIEQLTKLLTGVKLHTPPIDGYLENLQKLRVLEDRISSTDVRIIAEAVTSNATQLITFDTHYNTKSVDNLITVVTLGAIIP